MKFSFIVPGEPTAQPRVGRGRFAFVDTRSPIHAFRAKVGILCKEEMDRRGLAMIENVPVALTVVAVRSRPAWMEKKVGRGDDKHYLWSMDRVPCFKKPDLDNIIKGVKDAMKGIAWKDDALVWKYGNGTAKWYGEIGEFPHCEITVET